MRGILAAGLALGLAMAGGAAAQEVTRHRILGSDFPIAAAVEVPAGLTMVHLSGAVPPRADRDAPAASRAAWGGDTRGQTVAVLGSIERTLRRLNLGMGDVVRMQVFLVGDPALEGRMDFDGFREFFGTAAQPNLPVRSVVQVAGLVNPGWLVEIEVSAVRRSP